MINRELIKLIFSICLLTLSASLLWFKILLNSDTLFLNSLSNDLFNFSGHWTDWRLSPAPAYFPDMLLYFFAYSIFSNSADCIFFVSFVQVFILAGAVVWTAKQIVPEVRKETVSMLILFVAFITAVCEQSGMWLYFYSANNHFSSLIMPLICMGLFIRFYNNSSFKKGFVIIILGALAKVSSEVFVINFLLPGIISTILLLIVTRASKDVKDIFRNRMWIILAIFIATYEFSLFLGALLTYNTPLAGRMSFSPMGAGKSLMLFLQASVNAFSLNNKWTFSLSILVTASLVFLIYSLLKHYRINFLNNTLIVSYEDKMKFSNQTGFAFWYSFFFLMLIIPILIFGIVFSGGFVDLSGYRYLSFPIALTLILSLIVLGKYNLKLFIIRFTDFLYILLAISVFYSAFKIINSTHGQSKLVSHKTKSLLHCLMDIESKGFKLKSGLAGYWNARVISELLPTHNHITAVYNELIPYYWMSSKADFIQAKDYNFIILNDKSLKVSRSFSQLTQRPLMPSAYRVINCNEAKSEIWIYNDQKLNKVVKKIVSDFVK